MKKALFSILLTAAVASGTSAFADGPNAAFGVIAQGGYSSAWEERGEGSWSGGYGYGGGLVFETMFNETLGVQCGISFLNTEIQGEFTRGTGEVIDPKITSTSMEIPLYLLVSINRSSFSLVFLAGFTFSEILVSRMSSEYPSPTGTETDMRPYHNSFNAGATAGVLCRFRVTTYTDFYFGSTATFFFTDLFQGVDGRVVYPYDFRGVMGYLFRTNLFPPQ